MTRSAVFVQIKNELIVFFYTTVLLSELIRLGELCVSISLWLLLKIREAMNARTVSLNDYIY